MGLIFSRADPGIICKNGNLVTKRISVFGKILVDIGLDAVVDLSGKIGKGFPAFLCDAQVSTVADQLCTDEARFDQLIYGLLQGPKRGLVLSQPKISDLSLGQGKIYFGKHI